MKTDARAAVIERQPERPKNITQWEYRSSLMERDADLAQFGAEGWECYSVVAAGGDTAMFYFKRRRA